MGGGNIAHKRIINGDKSMSKRGRIVLILIMILLLLYPLTIKASANTRITEISLTVPAPVVGQPLMTNDQIRALNKEDFRYSINFTISYINDDRYLTDTYIVEYEGQEFRVHLHFNTNAGYVMDENTRVTVNGISAQSVYRHPAGAYVYMHSFISAVAPDDEPGDPGEEEPPEDGPTDYTELIKAVKEQTEVIELQTTIMTTTQFLIFGSIVGMAFLVLWRPTND
jgi:hypothetical protein